VIAETTDLGSRFAKIVVTDHRGRYVIPDLPKATYNVWVRGYGLVDSPKAKTEPGKMLNLTAVLAPSAAAASGHPSAKVYPLTRTPDGFVRTSRQVTVYDPKTKQVTFIDTCFGTHHLNFAEDANYTLWLGNNLQNELAIVGWVNTKLFWETGDAGKAQDWTPLIVDTNGNGKRDAYVEPNQPEDSSKDSTLASASMPSPRARRTAPSGARIMASPATSSGCNRARIRRRRRWWRSTRCRSLASGCMAWTSTAMAWRG
jgi:hypothetical protein